MTPLANFHRLHSFPRRSASPLLVAVALLGVSLSGGCDQTAETDYEKAVEAQAELERAREEAAEKVAEAEAKAVENIQDARQEARESIQETKQEAAEMVQDAEQNLQERLDTLSEKPLAPAADPAAEGVVVERKVIVTDEEPSEVVEPQTP
ncbi:hypothetical protein [Candidatus Laterigemmans baculatus]|uniref:hypothetical protein n=1 Tax=Candidatus Laterigemmans baculatus TaxID=2770505 RepID=UPI0013DB086E|nr:hypothetical protein [Candidatus Laterigemmans baculatus]